MPRKSTSIYIPIDTYNKLQRLQTKIDEILGKKPPLYKVIDLLIELQVKEDF